MRVTQLKHSAAYQSYQSPLPQGVECFSHEASPWLNNTLHMVATNFEGAFWTLNLNDKHVKVTYG